jgi:methionine aminopeptidase type I
MTELEAIKARHSVRKYLDRPIERAKLERLREEIAEINPESGLNVQLVQDEPKAFSSGMWKYGQFSGVRYYFVMAGPKGKEAEEKIGRYGEKLVLLAQILGLNTCWVGLTYKKIPGTFTLRDGDIVNVDCSTILNGYFSDSSRMFMIGEVSEEKRRLVEVTRECVEEGLKKVIPWTLMGDMSDAVHRHAMRNGYTVVREIGGHGCGNAFHEDPWVSFVAAPGTGMLMVPGMVFTIEPMVNMGGQDIDMTDPNGWTVRTADGLPTAQWEVQLVVTETGYELLSW